MPRRWLSQTLLKHPAGQVYLGCRYDEELEERLGNPVSLVKMPEKEGKITQQQAAKAQEASVRRRATFSRSACNPLIPTPLLAAVWDSRALLGAAGRESRPRLPCRDHGPRVRPDQVETRPANRASAKLREGERVAGGCEGGNGGRDVVRPCGDAAMGRAAPPRKRRFLCATFGTGRTSEVVQPGI